MIELANSAAAVSPMGPSVEQFFEERLLALTLTIASVIAALTLPQITPVQRGRLLRHCSRSRRGVLGAAVNDLIKFASIKPNATAGRAIINFYPRSLGHC